jgi:hypothetical protein
MQFRRASYFFLLSSYAPSATAENIMTSVELLASLLGTGQTEKSRRPSRGRPAEAYRRKVLSSFFVTGKAAS